MRRKDREVLDAEKIESIINSCHCCRLGLNDDGKVYVVPLSFGYENNNGKRYFYFHSAQEGRKIDLIKKNNFVGFEMDANYKLKEAEQACGYSARFQSIIGSGEISFIESQAEKIHALKQIMFHSTNKLDWTFPCEILDKMCVFRLEVTELSCKEHE